MIIVEFTKDRAGVMHTGIRPQRGRQQISRIWTAPMRLPFLLWICAGCFQVYAQVAPCQSDVQLPNGAVTSGSATYTATNYLSAGNGFLINNSASGNASVVFEAGTAICIGPGFHAVGGTAVPTFHAYIGSLPLSITTTVPLPNGTAGTPYPNASQPGIVLGAFGGTPPYTWAVASGSLPTGMTMSSSTIGGTPTTAGINSFTVQVTDAAARATTRNLSISVFPPFTLSGPSSVTVPLGQGTPITITGTAQGYSGTVVLSELSAPAGISLSPAQPSLSLSGIQTTSVSTIVTAGAGATSGTLTVGGGTAASLPIPITVTAQPPPLLSVENPAGNPSVCSTCVWGQVDFRGWAIENTPYLNDSISRVQFQLAKNDDTGLTWNGQATYGNPAFPRYDVCGGNGMAGQYPGSPGCPNVQFDYLWNSGQAPGSSAETLPNGSYSATFTAADSSAPQLTSTATLGVEVDNQVPVGLISSPVYGGDPAGTPRPFIISYVSTHPDLDIGDGEVTFTNQVNNSCTVKWQLDGMVTILDAARSQTISGTMGQGGSITTTDCTLNLAAASANIPAQTSSIATSLNPGQATVTLSMTFASTMNGTVTVSSSATNAIGQQGPSTTLTTYRVSPSSLAPSPQLIVEPLSSASVNPSGDGVCSGNIYIQVAAIDGTLQFGSNPFYYSTDGYQTNRTLTSSLPGTPANNVIGGIDVIVPPPPSPLGPGAVTPALVFGACDAGAAPGLYTMDLGVTATVAGTNTVVSTNFTLAVNVTSSMGVSFGMTSSPFVLSIPQGGQGSFSASIVPANAQGNPIQINQTDQTGITLNFPSNLVLDIYNDPISAQGTVTVPPNMAPGYYLLTYNATIYGSSYLQMSSVLIQVTPAGSPNFAISSIAPESVAAGGSVTFTAEIVPENDFIGTVSLPSLSSPYVDPTHHLTLYFGSGTVNLNGSSPVTITGTITTDRQYTASTATLSPPYYTIQVNAIGNPSGGGAIPHSSSVQISVQGGPNPDFSVSASGVSLPLGGSAYATIALTPISGFTGPVTLSLTGVPNGMNVSYNRTVNMISGATPTVSLLSFTTTGLALQTNQTYTMTLTATGSPGTHPATISVRIANPLPLAGSVSWVGYPISGIVGDFCIFPTGGVPPYSYSWSGSAAGSFTECQGFTPPVPNPYTENVVVTDLQNTPLRQSSTIVINNALGLTISASSPQVVGKPVTLTANAFGGIPPYSYTWQSPLTGNQNPISFTPGAPQTYNVKVTVSDSGSTPQIQVATQIISVGTALTVAPPTVNPPAPVTGQIVTFTANATGGVPPYMYNWSPPATGNGSSAHFTAGSGGSVTETVTVTDSSGQTTANSVMLSVTGGIGVTILAAADDPLVNQTDQLTATINDSTGNSPIYTYAWTATGGTFLPSSTVSAPTFQAGTAGPYTISLQITDSNNVVSNMASTTISVQANSSSLTINPTLLNSVTCAAVTGTINVSGTDSWTATPNENWITVTPPASGTGSGTVVYMASMNTSGTSRTGTISIGSQTFTFVQPTGTIAPKDFVRLDSRIIAIESPGCITTP